MTRDWQNFFTAEDFDIGINCAFHYKMECNCSEINDALENADIASECADIANAILREELEKAEKVSYQRLLNNLERHQRFVAYARNAAPYLARRVVELTEENAALTEDYKTAQSAYEEVKRLTEENAAITKVLVLTKDIDKCRHEFDMNLKEELKWTKGVKDILLATQEQEKQENARLTGLLEKAREMAEFYGDVKIYHRFDNHGIDGGWVMSINEGKPGEKARAFLAELENFDKERK